MMTNKPEFISIWIGMAKIGVSSALLNVNTTGKGLIHGVTVAVKSSEQKIFVV